MIKYENYTNTIARLMGVIFFLSIALGFTTCESYTLSMKLVNLQFSHDVVVEPGGNTPPVMFPVSSTQTDIPPAQTTVGDLSFSSGEGIRINEERFGSWLDRTEYRITCYGPPQFPETNLTARGISVRSALATAKLAGLDGICAVSPDTPWYSHVRDEAPSIIQIDGFGKYHVVDRTAGWVRGVIDIYNPDLSPTNMWSETREVYEY